MTIPLKIHLTRLAKTNSGTIVKQEEAFIDICYMEPEKIFLLYKEKNAAYELLKEETKQCFVVRTAV